MSRTRLLIGGTTVLGIAVAILLSLWSLWLGIGFAKLAGWQGYIEKLNWSLFPIYFLLVGGLCVLSWRYYVQGWMGIGSGRDSLLYEGTTQVVDSKTIKQQIKLLDQYRWRACWFSLAVGLSLSALDFGCLWGDYGILNVTPCGFREQDFSIALLFPDAFRDPPMPSRAWNLAFNLVAYFMQGLLIFLAILAFLQLSLHTLVLLLFESTRFARGHRRRILLNHRDKLHEFGLSTINDAINLNYVFIAACMVIPVMSAYMNTGEADLGQYLLRFLVPLILLLPGLFPVIERVNRWREVRHRVSKMNSKADQAAFDQQRLWPFDARFLGKIGKMALIVCALEYGYLTWKNARIIVDLISKIL